MNTADYINLKDEIALRIKEKNYALAQAMIKEALIKFPHDSDLLLKKYVCSWFVSAPDFIEDIAESTLEVSARLSPDSDNIQIELGNHYYAVSEDAPRAKACFRKALDLALKCIREAYLGLAKIAIDENSKADYQLLTEEISLLSEDVLDYCRINAEVEALEEPPSR